MGGWSCSFSELIGPYAGSGSGLGGCLLSFPLFPRKFLRAKFHKIRVGFYWVEGLQTGLQFNCALVVFLLVSIANNCFINLLQIGFNTGNFFFKFTIPKFSESF